MAHETIEKLRERLAEALDDDGLVAGVFDEIEQDWVRVGQHWVGLDRRLPWQLSQCFRQYSELLADLHLRLDLSEIESANKHASPIRKAYWWGAPFRWDRLDDHRPVETVHADPSSTIQSLNFIAQARFRWNFPVGQNIAVLQIEEFRDTPETPGGSFTTRYLHSILRLGERKFVHLDGAIKTYTLGTYADAYANPEVKAGAYEKLFRTDEKLRLGDDAWIAVVASFFANDELVREYFGGA